jgi:hypothetical protein
MRFMLIEQTGSATDVAAAMDGPGRDRFEQALVRAGVLLAAERLTPCEGAEAPAHALAGFWLIEVKSRDEAQEWARRAGGGARIQIRQAAQPEETTHAIPDPGQG